MQRTRPYNLRELGAGRALLLYYPTVLLGYPLVVAMLGHSQAEGWDFLKTRWGVPILLLVLPLCVVAAVWLIERIGHSIDPNNRPPTDASVAETDRPE